MMKKASLFLIGALAFASCQSPKNEDSSTETQEEIAAVKTEESSNILGVAFESGKAFPVAQLGEKLGAQDSMLDLTVSGNVKAVCQMKGCWMTLEQENGEDIRVTFKDYNSIVMPMDAAGKKVVIHGKVKRKEISIETLKHYAEDGGASEEEIAKITEPKQTLAFEADGVVIEEGK